MRAAFKLFAVLFGLAIAPLVSHAQGFPEKSIRLVVPWPAGGSADAIGRIIASALSTSLGKSVYVENLAGASGNIGTQQFVRSQPDGHTLLLATSTTNASNPNLFTKLGFDPINDFVPVAPVALAPSILIVSGNSPYKSPKELVDAAKTKSGGLSYGSGGNGNSGHLSGELFKSITKIDAQHVPYKGNAPAMIDLMGGQIDYMFDNGAISHIKSGKVRGLAVAAEQRLAAVPDVPTFKELGMAGMQLNTWFGIAAPKGTPAPIVEKINAAVNAALESPDVAKRLNDMGAQVQKGTAASFSAFWKEEIEHYRHLVKLSGAKIE